MTRLPHNKSGLLLTIAVHMALLWLVLARPLQQPAHAPDDGRPAMVWLRALPPRVVRQPSLPPRPPRPEQPARREQAAGRPSVPPSAPQPAGAAREAPPPDQAAARTAPQAVAEPTIGDLSTQPATPPVSAAELLRLTLHGAGKIDQELRGGKLAPLPPPGQTMRGKIDAAFEAAHQAVRPKWYERAKVSEITSPNSRIRVYKIRTALGTYCISMADASLNGGGYSAPSYSNCP